MDFTGQRVGHAVHNPVGPEARAHVVELALDVAMDVGTNA